MKKINVILIKNKIMPILILLAIALFTSAFGNVPPQKIDGEYNAGIFVSKVDKFEAHLPIKPKLLKTKKQGLLVKCYESSTDDAIYNVFVHEYKWDKLSKKSIDNYLTTLMTTSLNVWKNAEILYSKRSTLSGRPIIDFRASFQHKNTQFYKVSRIIMGKERTYALTIIYPQHNSDKVENSIIQFLDSFNIFDEKYNIDRYYDKERGFSIRFPVGWRVKEIDDSTIDARSPLSDSKDIFRELITINVIGQPPPESLDKEFENVLAEFRRERTAKILGSGQLSIDNEKVKWLIIQLSDQEPNNKLIFYILIKGHSFYTITCVAKVDTFLKYKPIFEKAVKSFRFE